MSSKSQDTVFITGANTGLGYEAVKALLQSSNSYHVYLGSRSVERGKTAIENLNKEVPNTSSTLELIEIDIESDESIQNAFKKVESSQKSVDVLINNAGGMFDKDLKEGKASIRETWNKAYNLNVSSVQVVTHTFLPLLLKSTNPRLLFIASGTASCTTKSGGFNGGGVVIPAKGYPKDPAAIHGLASYSVSKTALNMAMLDWTRILKNDSVKIWGVSPGFLATGLGGIGSDTLKNMGARDPSQGGNFIRDVIEGKRDSDVGKVIDVKGIQPW